MLTGLTILGDTSFKPTSGGVNDQNSTISLGGTSNHVLDEITMTRSVNDRAVVLGGLELPESNVNGDTTLTLGFKFVQHLRVLERPLVHLSSLLLEPLNHTLVNTTKLVDQMTSGSRFPRIDMANDHNVDVKLLFTHSYLSNESAEIKQYKNDQHSRKYMILIKTLDTRYKNEAVKIIAAAILFSGMRRWQQQS